MLWRELVDLEPALIDVKRWTRTLDPDAPQVMKQIKERLLPLVGWHRTIPCYEEVPFDGIWPAVREKREHDRLTGNRARKDRLFSKVPIYLRVLYTSEAWDVAIHHFTIVLRARRRELEKSSRTGQDERRTTTEEPPMFENDMASHGLLTIGDLRKRLKGKRAEALVHLCIEGFEYAPFTDTAWEAPQCPDEGEVGTFLLMPDPSSSICDALEKPDPIKTKYVHSITVIDPDTGGEVHVEIRKLESGGMVGIDGSWLESDEGPTYSPYDKGVELVIPDDEEDV